MSANIVLCSQRIGGKRMAKSHQSLLQAIRKGKAQRQIEPQLGSFVFAYMSEIENALMFKVIEKGHLPVAADVTDREREWYIKRTAKQ